MLRNIVLGLALVSGLSGLTVSLLDKKRDLVYIDMGKVYQEFSLSKELGKVVERRIKEGKLVSDSLYQALQLKTMEVKESKMENAENLSTLTSMEQAFYLRQQQIEKEVAELSADNESKVWNQMNKYITDYGKMNSYTFILGANGQGFIMHADSELDVTDDVIKYINRRYSGLEKN
ncbi:MAG: OmpH family outer membrane protein [Sphingobacteriaceae bacterium]|jgi:outer membrane protein